MHKASSRTHWQSDIVKKISAVLVLGLLMSACTTLSDKTPAEPQLANTEQYTSWDRKSATDIGTQLHNPFRKATKGVVEEVTNR